MENKSYFKCYNVSQLLILAVNSHLLSCDIYAIALLYEC